MALANIALLLARRGLRVLVVDWDLEAPGLERYFASMKMETGGAGLLPLILAAADGETPDYQDYLWKVIDHESDVAFALLQSGREGNTQYAKELNRFNWSAFFAEQGGGDFIENLRHKWREHFDIVLIDSRTGLTDAGGICTIQLPDIVVPMFTANYQSLYGVRDVIRFAQRARQALAYDRMPLTIFPLPSRFSVRSEFEESQDWIDRFEEALSEFYSDWLPSWASPRSVLERIKIPQIDYFGFGEKLAVVEHGMSDPESMGFVYNRVAELLAGDFSDIEKWLGEEARAEAERATRLTKSITSQVSSVPSGEYEYDIFVSYAQGPMLAEWMRDFVRLLSQWVEEATGKPLKVFFDVGEIQIGDSLPARLGTALARSKLLLVVASARYFHSQWAMREWLTFVQRTKITGANLIIPIVLSGRKVLPPEFTNFQYTDMSDYAYSTKAFRETKKYFEFQTKVRDLAQDVVQMLEKVPPFDLAWTIASDDDVDKLTSPKFDGPTFLDS